MRNESKKEYLKEIRKRYFDASRKDKAIILTTQLRIIDNFDISSSEFIFISGYILL